MNINRRIVQYCNLRNIKQKDLVLRGIGATQTISDIYRNKHLPSCKVMVRFLTQFPEVSADWLVLGTGSMLKQHNVTIDKRTIGNIVTNSSKSKIITHVNSDDKLKVENDFLKRQLDDKDEIISLLKQKIELLNG